MDRVSIEIMNKEIDLCRKNSSTTNDAKEYCMQHNRSMTENNLAEEFNAINELERKIIGALLWIKSEVSKDFAHAHHIAVGELQMINKGYNNLKGELEKSDREKEKKVTHAKSSLRDLEIHCIKKFVTCKDE